MSNDNVIQFPKDRIVRKPPKNKQTKKQLEDEKRKKADILFAKIMERFFDQFDNEKGFDKDNADFIKDFVFITESIRSCVYRIHGIHHRLQEYVDEHIKIKVIEKMDNLTPEEEVDRIEELLEEMVNEESLDKKDIE